MASASPESRRSMQRRDSSTSSGTKRRPRLLRACATEPFITTSNASRGVLAGPQSSRRATDLLTQVAYVSSSSPDSLYRGSSPPSAQSPMYSRMERTEDLSSSPPNSADGLDEIRPYPCWFPSHQHIDQRYKGLTPKTDSGRYFSFPSFDTWEVDQPEKEEGELKTS